jgi:hypothetical protein
MVVILFDAAATAKDGVPYRNTYTWVLSGEGRVRGQGDRLLRYPGFRWLLESSLAKLTGQVYLADA